MNQLLIPLLVLTAAPGPAPAPHATFADTLRWTLVASDSEARYLVREQLAGFDFPNDAVGRTSTLTGSLVLDASGRVVREGSRFEVDLTTLATDNGMRDNYVRRNTLRTAEHPAAVFVPTALVGIGFPLPEGEVTFRIRGDLTVVGETRPVEWTVTARVQGGGVQGTARTTFPFELFGIPKPRVARVLSVADDIRLELDFRMVPAGP